MRLGVYIQVPFCQTKCTYCNFHTGVVSMDKYAPYAEAVRAEITSFADLYAAAGLSPGELPKATVDTVYFGGGTPSLLDPRHLQSILESIRGKFACEWT